MESLVDNCSRNTLDKGEDTPTKIRTILIGALASLMIFLAIAGNILVLVAIYSNRNLRRIAHPFLASLAVADLMVAAVVMTLAAFNDILGCWAFSEGLCTFWVAADVMLCTASIFNIGAVSIDRYIYIKNPLRYSDLMTKRMTIGSIIGIWLLSGIVSFLPISLGLHRPPPDTTSSNNPNPQPTCSMGFTPTYAIISSSISFFGPCILMLLVYCHLLCLAHRQVQSIRVITRPISTNRPLNIRPPFTVAVLREQHVSMDHSASPYRVSDRKAAITVGVIMGTFLVCWFPFFVCNIIVSICKDCIPRTYFKLLIWCGYSNSAFNPIIYTIFNKEFRDAFRRILTHCQACPGCCKGYRPAQDQSTRSARAASTRSKVMELEAQPTTSRV